jgi:anti-anti-sigma factor
LSAAPENGIVSSLGERARFP